jgi:hypothetical protein
MQPNSVVNMEPDPYRGDRSMKAICLAFVTYVCLTGCGAASAPSNTARPTPTAHIGAATAWRVVIKAQSGEVTGLALDGQGHMYLAELFNDKIAEFSLDGTLVTQWGESGNAPGQLNQPAKVALDASGDVYVTEVGNDHIQKFSANGMPLAQWGGTGTAPGKFMFPVGIVVDGRGNIYVADADNHRIQKLSPRGTPLAQWTGHASTADASVLPYDLALAGAGDLLVGPNVWLGQYLGCTGPTGLTFVDANRGWMTWDCIRRSEPFPEGIAPVLVTTDGGRTWSRPTAVVKPLPKGTATGNVPNWSCGASPPVFSQRSGVIPVTCADRSSTNPPLWSGVLRTTDAGETWSLGQLPIGVGLAQIGFVDADTGYAFSYRASGNDLYMTVDGGRSWALINTALFPGQRVVSFQFADADHGFATTAPAATSWFMTADGGRTWRRLSA